MHHRTVAQGERGMALVTVLLITFIVGTAIVAGVLLGGNAYILNRFHDRYSVLEAAADAGLEQGRSMVNGNKALYPGTGYSTLENGVAVKNATGAVIPGVTRWLYAGPVGIKSGQYGIYGSVVSVVQDQMANTVVRRVEMQQESFAKYAYFSNQEGGKGHGGGEIWGPFHTNDSLILQAPGGQIFHGPVTVGKNINGVALGTFDQGYKTYVPVIPLPSAADLNALKAQAQAGGTYFLGNTVGSPYKATTRIEFVAQDLSSDADLQPTASNEGFFRVYQSLADPNWVMASTPADSMTNGLLNSSHCGHSAPDGTADGALHTTAHPFFSAALHGTTAERTTALQSATRRCYLGGAEQLTLTGLFNPVYRGAWVKWTDFPNSLVLTARPNDAKYLFPATRDLNPNFKGVIYVEGNVAVSGTLRGRVTVVATGAILVVDDITYVTNPAVGTCADMLGLWSGTSIWVAGNTLNAPQRSINSSAPYIPYDETKDEFIHGVILALSSFGVENATGGPQAFSEEPCETSPVGRGCLYITGGVINDLRAAVGGGMGGGYLKRYSWDACGLNDPPPYFPTTWHFSRGRYFDVDPTGFNITTYFNMLQQ